MSDVKATDEKFFLIDLNGWKMADFRSFLTATKEDRWDDILPLLAKVIKAWPFETELSDAAVIDMGLGDLAATMKAVNKAVNNAFSEGN